MALTEDQKKQYWEYVNGENNLKELEYFVKEIEEQPEDINELIHLKNGNDKTALDILCELSNLDDSSSVVNKISFLLSFSKDFYTSSKPPLSFLRDSDTDKKIKFLFFLHQWRLKVCENKNIPNFNRTLFLVGKSLEYMSKIECYKNSSGIFIFGKTRVGKSTFINYLLGTDYDVIFEDYEWQTKNKTEENATVGRSLISETLYPGVYTLDCSNRNYLLVDMPGFDDNRQLNNSQRTLSPYEIASGVSTSVIEKKLENVFRSCLTIEFSSFLSSDVNDIVKPIQSFILTTVKIENIETFDFEILPNIFLIVTKIPKQTEAKNHITKRLLNISKSLGKIKFEKEIHKNFFTKILENWLGSVDEKVFFADITNDTCRNKFKEINNLKLIDIKKFNLENNFILEEFRKLVNVVDDISNEICREREKYNVQKEKLISNFNHELQNKITNITEDLSDSFQKIDETVSKFKSYFEEIERKIKRLDMLKDADNQFSKKLEDIRELDPTIFPRKQNDNQDNYYLTDDFLPENFYRDEEEAKENSLAFFSSNETKEDSPAPSTATFSSPPFNTQPTAGNGDCAFHAALGIFKEDENIYEVDNIEEKRQTMANVIINYKSHPKSSGLTPLIKEAILAFVMGNENISALENLSNLRNDNKIFTDDDNKRLMNGWDVFEDKLKNEPKIINKINDLVKIYLEKNRNINLKEESSLKTKFDTLRADTEHNSNLETIILDSDSQDLTTAYNTYIEVINAKKVFEFELTEKLLEEYASYISQPGQWLLLSELGIIAYVFDLSIVCKIDNFTEKYNFNENKNEEKNKEVVYVNFDTDHRHFERMIQAEQHTNCQNSATFFQPEISHQNAEKVVALTK